MARPIPMVTVDHSRNGRTEAVDFKEQIRELLAENSSSAEGTASGQSPNHPHSGYLTDTSSATWQFNGGASSFSPHSLVSVNGGGGGTVANGNGLLKVVSSSSSSSLRNGHQRMKERSVIKVEPPPPIQRREPRKEIVEVRREIIKAAPAVKHTVHRIEEKKRTEEVERRVVRKERRHKSRRLHRAHHSSSAAAMGGGHQQEYHYGSWGGGGGGGGGGGYRSSSASRRSGYTNGFGGGGHGMEHHLPITYEGSRSAASDRYFGGARQQQHQQNGFSHGRYGSVSDSLRRGDLKYGPNGELLVNGSGNVKHHRVHKAHSTRDVFYHGDGGGGGADSQYSSFQRRGAGPEPPFVEFPPTLDRRSDFSGPEPPPHHRRQFADEYASGGAGVHQLTKARSFADWEEGGGGRSRSRSQFGSKHDEDMARLENEFRDARLMRIPSGNMQEKEHHHREIPGGYETYSRETKAHSDRKLDGGGEHQVPVVVGGTRTPTYRSREASQDFSFKREGGPNPK